jgi:Uma2 family endonuclease
MATKTLLTIDDFERLPAEQAKNHELVEGELVDVSGNTWGHNSLRDRLVQLLGPIVRKQGLGEVIGEQEYDFGGNAHGPDVTFVSNAKLALHDPAKRVQRFVPDLAIEIVSQNDTFQALLRKKGRYRSSGTREVWIISPEEQEVFVYSDRGNRILKGNDAIETDLIPGFSITVAELLG